jgi:hypothetical protein
MRTISRQASRRGVTPTAIAKGASLRAIVATAIAAIGVILLVSPCEARAQSARDFAIYSAQDVNLESYSVIQGDIYAGRDINVSFGYGIQRPASNAGDFVARRNVLVDGLSDINGSVNANGSINFEYWVDVTGNVSYGTTYQQTGSPGTISGVVSQQPNTVPAIALPQVTSFTPGGANLTSNNLDLFPGSYGNIVVGSSGSLRLRAGTYYLSSLMMSGNRKLYLDLSPGESIRVYSQGDLNFGDNVFVNGLSVRAGLDASTRSLAANVLFESHGNVSIGRLFDEFFGTVFAPYGTVEGDTQYHYGSIVAGGPVTGAFYIEHIPSALFAVPEPSGLAAGMTLLGLAWARARRRRRAQRRQ